MQLSWLVPSNHLMLDREGKAFGLRRNQTQAPQAPQVSAPSKTP